MICLTGDVHHRSLANVEARFLAGTEAESALRYLETVHRHGLRCTLFYTGLTALQEPSCLGNLSDSVEIAGHSYFAFKWRAFYNAWRKIAGLANGPVLLQNWEIRRTLKVLERTSKNPVVSWRDHGFRRDHNTPFLLYKNGVRYISDLVTPFLKGPVVETATGIIEVPVNTFPDNDFIVRSTRPLPLGTPVRVGGLNGRAMAPEVWMREVLSQVQRIVTCGGVATLLVHPACMEVVDKFKTFDLLCAELANYRSICIRDIGEVYMPTTLGSNK